MTDLRTLLHDAAPRPSRAVDVDALVREAVARRRPWRRAVLGLGAIIAAGGLGLGATGVLSPASHPTQIETTPTRVPAAGADDAPAAGGSSASDATATGSAAAPRAASVGAGNHASQVASDGPAASEPEGCHLRSGGAGVKMPGGTGGVGMDDMYANRCSYQATQAGGYRGTGSWSVTIERNGVSTTYDYARRSPACGGRGTIRPGDVVTVSIRTGGATSPDAEVWAGPQDGCP